MSEPATFKYRAFISYSHVDTGWARWLHRGLESFLIDKDLAGRTTATGVIPAALRPIFRDRDDFTAGKTLAEQTLAALDASAALIVVCSPAAAKSHYVNEEIGLFKSRYPTRPVIPLIVAGKPDDAKSECFPPALKFKLNTDGQPTTEADELLAADAQEEADGKNLALAKVVAGLIGVSSDEIFRRADRERRAAQRRRRRLQAGFAALGILLVAAGVAWLNHDYLREQAYWYFTMKPTVLMADQEHVLKPGDEFVECANGCPQMVVVPAGKFTMGSRDDEVGRDDTEGPQHEVTIGWPFAIGKYEVTFAEWDACVAQGACSRAPDSGWGRGERPVINVTWDDAHQYVAWLSRLSGRSYRLLSEAEWEYAARARTTTRYYFGDDEAALGDYEWYFDNSEENALPVGKKKPNAFSLYDMLGNVWEWVEDRWHDNYNDAPLDGSAWVEHGDPNNHVLRGGSWSRHPIDLRSAFRIGASADYLSSDGGFRVARTLNQ